MFNNHCLVLSPHLDDAVFSAGSYISKLIQDGYQVSVITLFTAVNEKNPTQFAKNFTTRSGFSNSNDLFMARKQEDFEALKLLGVDNVVHGDFIDAAWRTFNNQHLYPTTYSVFSGEINPKDNIIDKLFAFLNPELVEGLPFCLLDPIPNLLLAPLGIGNHVDHIITHQLAQKLAATKKLYWADQPYQHYTKYNFSSYKLCLTLPPTKLKSTAVDAYKSQIKSIDPSYSPHQSTEFIYESSV